jgi:MFS family permease
LCLCNGTIALQAAITISLQPVYAVQLGANAATTGLMVSLAYLAVTLGNITGGWLSDRLGQRKPLLLLSCAMWIPILLLMPVSTALWWLMLTTTLAWFPGGIAIAAISSIAALSSDESERGKVFGWMAVAAGLGSLVAGAIAGPIAARWGFPMLFIVSAARGCFLFVVALYVKDKETQTSVIRERAEVRVPNGQQASVGFSLILLLVAHLSGRLAGSIGKLGSPLAMTSLGFEAVEVSSAIAISSAVALPIPLLLGWLSDKAGRKRFLLFCYTTGSLALFVLMPAAALWHFWLSSSLLTIAGSDMGVAQAYATDLTPPQVMGRGMSLLNTFNLIAGIIGSAIAGLLMQAFGLTPTLLLGACLPLLSIALVLRIPKPVPLQNVRMVAQVSGISEAQ